MFKVQQIIKEKATHFILFQLFHENFRLSPERILSTIVHRCDKEQKFLDDRNSHGRPCILASFV